MFDGIVKRLDTAEERISELEDISVETQKTKKQREKKTGSKNGKEYPGTVGQLQKM